MARDWKKAYTDRIMNKSVDKNEVFSEIKKIVEELNKCLDQSFIKVELIQNINLVKFIENSVELEFLDNEIRFYEYDIRGENKKNVASLLVSFDWYRAFGSSIEDESLRFETLDEVLNYIFKSILSK